MTYVFKTPFSHAETVSMVEKTITAIGGKFKNDVGNWRAKGFATVLSATAQFFFHEKENECSVRVVFRRHHTDSRRFWRTFVEKLNELSAEIYKGISSGREEFSFYYDFSKENISESEIKEKLKENIEKSRESDFKRLYTNAGPHTDDIVLTLNGRDARIYGSQGQQRSCALALKLGEASIIEKITGECPVVLLDDVMSELDEGRQTFILNYLDNWQVFITCCDPSQLLRSKKGKAFEVKEGKISEMG